MRKFYITETQLENILDVLEGIDKLVSSFRSELLFLTRKQEIKEPE